MRTLGYRSVCFNTTGLRLRLHQIASERCQAGGLRLSRGGPVVAMHESEQHFPVATFKVGRIWRGNLSAPSPVKRTLLRRLEIRFESLELAESRKNRDTSQP